MWIAVSLEDCLFGRVVVSALDYISNRIWSLANPVIYASMCLVFSVLPILHVSNNISRSSKDLINSLGILPSKVFGADGSFGLGILGTFESPDSLSKLDFLQASQLSFVSVIGVASSRSRSSVYPWRILLFCCVLFLGFVVVFVFVFVFVFVVVFVVVFYCRKYVRSLGN
jgi:hypothetical protein